MTLNDLELNTVFATVLLASETASFGNNCVNINKDKPMLLAAAQSPAGTRHKVYADSREVV